MKFLFVVFTLLSLVFANVASAAVHCCFESDQNNDTTMQHSGEENCHETQMKPDERGENSLHPDAHADCQCEACVQIEPTYSSGASSVDLSAALAHEPIDQYALLDLSKIKHPPRSL